MSDYISHIKHTAPALKDKYWCGRKVTPEFAFMDIDHATYNRVRKGRLLPCKQCVRKIVRLLQSED